MRVFDSILVSSHPKSGTVLVEHIIKRLTGKENLKSAVRNQEEFSYADSCNIYFEKGSNCKLVLHRRNEHKALIESEVIDVDSDIIKNYLSDNGSYCVEHISPAAYLGNHLTASFKYKIFVVRDFRDVFNSRTKFVDDVPSDIRMIEFIGNYSDYQKFSYLNPNSLMKYLYTWKKYVSEYVLNRNHMYLLRYEDLMYHPESCLESLARYLELSLGKEQIDSVIAELFNKDLTKAGNLKHPLSRHFSGSSKRSGEWLEWFNDDMVEIVKREIGDYLIEFGYEKDNNWSVPSVDSGEKAAFRQKQNFVYSSYKHKGQFAMMLDILLEKKRAAIYGAGLYTHRLLDVLDNSSNIVFIADDDSCKWGGYINGVEISGSENLIKRYMDYDVLLVAVHPQHRGKVIEKLDEMTISRCIMIDAYNENIDFGIFA